MTAKKKPKAPEMPALTCAACQFCLGARSDWECWGNLPKADQGESKHNRGEPIDPQWPACYFFKQRCNA
jgi:hypothetical protein